MEANPAAVRDFDELRHGMRKAFPDGDKYVINPIQMQCPFAGCKAGVFILSDSTTAQHWFYVFQNAGLNRCVGSYHPKVAMLMFV